MVYRKLHVVARQAQAAVSEETANNQPSSDVEQPEPILVCSPCFLPAAAEIPVTIVTNKDHNRKRQVKQMKFPSVLLLTKAVKGESKTPKYKIVQTTSNQ